MTQTQISKVTGISQTILSRYESESKNVNPNAYNVILLSDCLSVTPEFLLGVEEELAVSIETSTGKGCLEVKKIENFSKRKKNNVFKHFKVDADILCEFFIQNESDALFPLLKKGDLLFFTLEGKPVNDDIVLIRKKQGEHKEIRVFKEIDGRINLLAINVEHENHHIPELYFNDAFDVLGILIGF